MKIRTLLTLLAVITCTNFSYAAFPKYSTNETSIEAPHINITSTDTIKKKQIMDDEDEADEIDSQPIAEPHKNNALGATSLILSSVGMASIVAAFIVASTTASAVVLPLLVIAFALGLTGLITGAKAVRRKEGKGMGIAGLVLGIVDISIVAVISFLAVLIASITI